MSKHITLVSHDHSSSLAIVDSCTKDKHQRFRMIQVNLSKALPKTGTIEDTFTSLSQTWRNQGTDQSAHLTPTWIWTKMHCSTFTSGATTFTSTEPLQFCKWVDKSKWGKAGKGYKNNRTKLNWQTQESKAKQPIMTNSILTIQEKPGTCSFLCAWSNSSAADATVEHHSTGMNFYMTQRIPCSFVLGKHPKSIKIRNPPYLESNYLKNFLCPNIITISQVFGDLGMSFPMTSATAETSLQEAAVSGIDAMFVKCEIPTTVLDPSTSILNPR